MKRHQPLHVHLPNLLFLVAIILLVLYLWSCIG